jgi:hypothetical protein
LVCPFPTQADGLLGTDILDRIGAEINFESGKLSNGNCKAPPACSGISADRTALTVFPEHELGRKTQVMLYKLLGKLPIRIVNPNILRNISLCLPEN